MNVRKFQLHNKYWLIFYLILFYAYAPTEIKAQVNLPDIVKKVKPSVVAIYTYDKAGKALAQGSGFFISREGDVITNWHVLEGASRAEIKTAVGNKYLINLVLAEDKAGDLLRLSTNIKNDIIRPLQLSKSIPEEGERIVVIGNPLGLEQTISDGIISAVREIPGYGKIIQITAPISSGSSGSPVVNMKGEVVGVATLVMVEGQNINFAVSSDKIAKLKLGKKKALAEWQTGREVGKLISAEKYFNLGRGLVSKDDYRKALDYFKMAIKEDSHYSEAYFFLGLCYSRIGENAEAFDAFNQAIRIKPDFADAYLNLGVVYSDLGRYTDAIKAYKQAIRIQPDYAEAHCNLGIIYSSLKRYAEALEAYKQAIRINPDSVFMHLNLGLAYSDLGRYAEALEVFKQAIRIKPDFADAYFNLGNAYGNLGRHEDAIKAYKQVIMICPEDSKAHFNLGLEYLAYGDTGSAFNEYKILKNLSLDLANELFNVPLGDG